MTAAIHPGPVRHCWDHAVVTLRDETAVETAFLSLYAITYSAALGAGHVCLLRAPAAGIVHAILTDAPEVARRMVRRLRAMTYPGFELGAPIVAARFERRPFTADGLGFDITSDGLGVEVRWLEPSPPFWMIAPAPDLAPDEDIWAMFVEARDAALRLDGVAVRGRPFLDEAWVPKLGRAVSSAHVAFSEVRVEPVHA